MAKGRMKRRRSLPKPTKGKRVSDVLRDGGTIHVRGTDGKRHKIVIPGIG